MLVKELIRKLQALSPEARVTVYEHDGDYWDNLAEVRLALDNEVHLVGDYGVQWERNN